MSKPELLGRPLRVGRLELRNRVVSPPMERNYGTPDGCLTDRYLSYLQARAAGGTALVFTEATFVRADGRGRAHQLGAHDDRVVPGLRALADRVHAEGALLGVELNHAGRVADPAVSGFPPVAPSPVAFRGLVPRELSTAEVADVVTAFGAAARRCARAGVDVLELHAAHGYLIHQFLSPRTNRRTDRYADPVLFLNEILQVINGTTPVFLRLSAFEGVPDGLSADATLALSRRMRLDLVDVLDISAGSYEAGEWMVQPGETSRGVLAPYAARFRELGKPVCVAGRISTADAAEQVLRTSADLVAVGRALHADAEWTAKALAGVSPRPCIGCNQGCIDVLHTQQPIWCVVDPPAARPAPALSRRVLIIGAGVAGLAAARAAALQGHTVAVLEEQASIGGLFRLAARLPSRPEFVRLLDWYAAELARLGVEVRTSAPATAEIVAAWQPGVVVVATGGRSLLPRVPGSTRPRVVDVPGWLRQPRPVRPGEVVTVWGADRAGVAVADAAAAAGHRVLVLAATGELVPEAGAREKVLQVRRLHDSPAVRLRFGTTLAAVEDDGLLVGHQGATERLDVSGPVVVSQGVGTRADAGPAGPWLTVRLGPAGSAAEAIRQGAALGLESG